MKGLCYGDGVDCRDENLAVCVCEWEKRMLCGVAKEKRKLYCSGERYKRKHWRKE